MSEKISRLTKNSVALFFRMALRLVISLYTTRVILDVLGTTDYGIYIVVSGFSLMLAFVNSSMGTAIARFLSFSIGKKESETKQTDIFQTALSLQLIIAVVMVILGIVAGYVFIYHYLNIPADRLNAANYLYICTLFGLALNTLQVPYNATIIAYEKMTAYAYIEIVNSALMLAIAFLLKLKIGDSLKAYGTLLLCVYAAIFITYIIYCLRFKICRFRIKLDKAITRPLLTFVGADFFFNSSMSLQSQGQNVIFNKFYTLASNAGIGIANQIYGAMLMFSSSITTAIRPQIIKDYAAGERESSLALTLGCSRILSMALISISVPLVIRINNILEFWLGKFPESAPLFGAIILIMNATFGYKGILVILLHAEGNIGKYSIFCGIWFLLAIPIQYILASLNISDVYNYSIIFLLAFGNVVINLYFICRNLDIKLLPILIKYGFPPIIGMILCLGVSKLMDSCFSQSAAGSILFGSTSLLISLIICWFVVLDKSARNQVQKIVSPVIKKIIH